MQITKITTEGNKSNMWLTNITLSRRSRHTEKTEIGGGEGEGRLRQATGGPISYRLKMSGILGYQPASLIGYSTADNTREAAADHIQADYVDCQILSLSLEAWSLFRRGLTEATASGILTLLFRLRSGKGNWCPPFNSTTHFYIREWRFFLR